MTDEKENPNAGIWQKILSESTTAEGVSIDGRSIVVLGSYTYEYKYLCVLLKLFFLKKGTAIVERLLFCQN